MKINPTYYAVAMLITALATGSVWAQRTKPKPRVIHELVTIRGSDSVKAAGPALTPAQQRRQDAFVLAWETLNYYYFDKTFSGLDWNKVRSEFQPRVTAAESDAKVHSLILEMINRLDRSHFGIIPPEYFDSMRLAKARSHQREKQLARGKVPAGDKGVSDGNDADDDDDDLLADDPDARFGVGIELRMIDNRFVITSVEQHSSASLVGLKPGFVIDKINGVAMTELVNRIMSSYPDIRHLQHYLPTQVVAWFLNGARDTDVFLTCLDGNDVSKEYKVPRLTLSGQSISIGERFPTQFLQYRSSSLNDDVGYIKFNVFALPVIDKFCNSMTEFGGKKAIIVDLRGNLGGLLGTLYGLTGMLTDHSLLLGTAIYRNYSEPFAIKSKAKNFKGKIVFLVDDQTMSAAELFSSGMRDNSRVVIVGDRTAGEALTAVSIKLATGAVLEYPIATFRTIKGKFLEANGVEPDYTVALDRKDLVNGIDTQIQKALDIIKDAGKVPAPAITADLLEGDLVPPPEALPKHVPSTTGGQGSGLGSGQPPPPRALPTGKDQKAVELLGTFALNIGGIDALNKVLTYEATGKGLIGRGGMESAVRFKAVRQAPDKYTLILTTEAMGETRQINNDKGAFLQTDFGLDLELFHGPLPTNEHLFEAITNILDPNYLVWLAYDGVYDDQGRKMYLVEGRTKQGISVALTFDEKTKMLVRFTGPGVVYTFDDFRKTGDVLLPFAIKLDGVMDIHLDSLTVNSKIDPANLQKKEMCFDRP